MPLKPVTATILGGGITGLTAAHRLHRHGISCRVLEAGPVVGGASRTINFNGFRFDLGGHRFYTRNEELLQLVDELLGAEMLTVSRISHIFLNERFVDYPLSFFNALGALGPAVSLAVAGSYAWERVKRLFSAPAENTFEQWVVSRFGRRLYEIYFKPYSEKVWGIPCNELGADFAAQRIKGLSFREAVRNMFFRGASPPTLASSFLYPRLGFGRIPEAMREGLPEDAVELEARVIRVEHDGKRLTGVVYRQAGAEHRLAVDQVIGTIPVDDLISSLVPPPPQEVLAAAAALKYRDMIIIFLTLDREQVTADHWIYFPTEQFFSRIHEPKNWSRAMTPAGCTSLVVEVFCFADEPVYSEADSSLVARTTTRLVELGLIRADEVSGSSVVRLKKAYPLYVKDYRQNLATVRGYLKSFPNLQLAGRNGLYRYTSADYYMVMGLRAADNVMGANHDLDIIATSGEYAEK